MKPRSFRSREHLVDSLRTDEQRIAAWFDAVRHTTIEDVVSGSVGSSTFRAFHNMPRQPSVTFNLWAAGWLAGGVAGQVSELTSPEEYDEWNREAAERLSLYWAAAMGPERPMPYGPGRKMVDLVMKEYVRSADLDDEARRKLTGWLHVPLDSSTLDVVRVCATDVERDQLARRIPRGATMGFVSGPPMYEGAQRVLRSIAAEAGAPPIYLDVLIWNVPDRAG